MKTRPPRRLPPFRYPAFFAGLLLLAAASPATHAGEAAAANVNVRFRALGWAGSIEGLNYDAGSRVLPVSITSFVRSPYYTYAGPAQLQFFRVQPGADGKESRSPAGSVSLAGVGAQPLLIFVADPARPNSYQITAMSDAAAGFPAGSFKFCNLTGETVHVSLDGIPPVTLAPRAQTPVRVRPAEGTDAVNLRLYKRTAEGEEDIFSEAWRYQPALRRLILIAKVPDGGGGTRTEVKWLDEGENTLAPRETGSRRGN